MTNEADDRFAFERFPWLDPFVPNRWYRGGWLQTLSIKAIRPKISTDNWEGAAEFTVQDDRTPPDRLRGYFLPVKSQTYGSASKNATVVFFHGMGGHARSGYMLSMAACLLDAGYNVILWNNRGAGKSADECSRFHHPGQTDDVRLLVGYLRSERPEWSKNGLAAVAFSLGANVLLKYLAEEGEESAFLAAASISAPLDMEITSKNLRRGVNRLFDRYLLYRQQQELLRDASDLTDEQRNAIENAASVWELDDTFTAPHLGYGGAEAFYKANSAIHVLNDIRTPTLLFHATDDPVVDVSVFDDHDWKSDGPLYPALAKSGGHTGFINRDGSRWHEKSAVRFFDAMLGSKR